MENLYESPELSVVECQIEKGFAASPDSDPVDIGGEGTPLFAKNFTRKWGKKYRLSVSPETVKCFSRKT